MTVLARCRNPSIVQPTSSGRLGDALRWEESRRGERFPHLYGRIEARHVVWSRPLARGTDGRFRFPEEIGP